MATKLSLKEGVNWSDPQKAAKKKAALARAGKVRGGKPMAGASKAGAAARGGKPMSAGEKAGAAATAKPAKVRGSITMSGAASPAPTKAKAKPTMTSGSMKATLKRPEQAVKVDDVQNKIEAPAKSGLPKAKRDIKVGGLVGRTGGKWHLGKKVGKG